MGIDTLIVFGYGPVTADGKLKIYARLTALAAGLLLTRGETQRVLISGGKTGGSSLPSEAALMAAYLTRMFGLSGKQILLEETARDTLENLVSSANLLDREGFTGYLGFLALQMHLPRIEHIADLIGLKGKALGVEPLVATRSGRHRKVLGNLKRVLSYKQLAASQVRAMRGLRTLPSFWLPPLGELENPARLRHVQSHPAGREVGFPKDIQRFQQALRHRPRRYPDPQPDDERRGLELVHA